MSLDIHSYIAEEPTTLVLTSGAGPFFSGGANYGADVPGSIGYNDAGGLIVVISDGGGGLGGLLCDIIVQTATEDANPSGETQWVDTASRLNGISSFDTFQLHLTDPIITKVRAKLVKSSGTQNVNIAYAWMSDRAVELL